MKTLASSTSGTTIISGSRQRFQATFITIATIAVTAIFTMVAARFEPSEDTRVEGRGAAVDEPFGDRLIACLDPSGVDDRLADPDPDDHERDVASEEEAEVGPPQRDVGQLGIVGIMPITGSSSEGVARIVSHAGVGLPGTR